VGRRFELVDHRYREVLDRDPADTVGTDDQSIATQLEVACVTVCPLANASARIREPIVPVAPKSTTRIPLLLVFTGTRTRSTVSR
jgi:hypothetical protein